MGNSVGSPGDWEKCKTVYGLTQEQAVAYADGPLDNLQPLASARIPILCVCGAADTVVPMKENTNVLEERYRALGGPIQVIVKPDCDTHPHSLEDPTPIVAFVMTSTANLGDTMLSRQSAFSGRAEKGVHSRATDELRIKLFLCGRVVPTWGADIT
jgi:hypothetical protein